MTDDAIDFDKADVPDATETEAPSCGICGSTIGQSYYEIAGRMSCPGCNERVSVQLTSAFSLKTFVRAIGYGGGAAIAGSFVWYWFGKLTGLNISLIAIGIGIVVGLAIKKATGGIGGKRYQALAIFLTYSAIVWTHVPGIVDELRKMPTTQAAAPATSGVAPVPAVTPVPSAEPANAAPVKDPGPPPTLGQFVLAWVFVFGLAYAVPFLRGVEGLLGLLIIGIGLYEAWKFTRGVPIKIAGPFTRDG